MASDPATGARIPGSTAASTEEFMATWRHAMRAGEVDEVGSQEFWRVYSTWLLTPWPGPLREWIVREANRGPGPAPGSSTRATPG